MRTIVKYFATPLFLLFVASVYYARHLWQQPEEKAVWGIANMVFTFVAIPSFILNLLSCWFVHDGSQRIMLQLAAIVVGLLLLLFTYF